MNTNNILEALNNYDGDNIWDDVIETIAYDQAATDEIDKGQNDVFIADGVEYRHIAQSSAWIAR